MGNRIHSIDAIRGFCLLNIFVNHLSFGFLNQISPSRIAFCDSADVFVLLAGISCFLAYGPRSPCRGRWLETADLIRRCRTLYFFNLLIILISLLIMLLREVTAPLGQAEPAISLIQEHGLSYVWHLLTMQQSVGFSVVLRLYVLLLLVAPLYIWLAAKRFWYPLPVAGLVWLISGHTGLAEYESLTGVPLMLTFLPWNLPFALGISLGAAIRADVRIPSSRLALAVATAIVLSGPICFAIGARISPDVLNWIEARNDSFWLGASKRLQSPLRVAYLVSLAWIFIALARAPVVRLIHGVAPDNLFCCLGRHSLKVFTTAAIAAMIIEQIREPLLTSFPNLSQAFDVAAITIGFGAMLCASRHPLALHMFNGFALGKIPKPLHGLRR